MVFCSSMIGSPLRSSPFDNICFQRRFRPARRKACWYAFPKGADTVLNLDALP